MAHLNKQNAKSGDGGDGGDGSDCNGNGDGDGIAVVFDGLVNGLEPTTTTNDVVVPPGYLCDNCHVSGHWKR